MTFMSGFGDKLGPVKVIHVQESSFGLDGVLVIDNVAVGPAIGGLRMAVDVTVDECRRLARAMTLKNAAAGLAHGGGKSIIRADPTMAEAGKETLVRAFACALRGVDDYIFGPDMGTNEVCMAWVRDEIGRAVGLPRVLGGIPLDEIGATGWGLYHSVKVALESLGRTYDGVRIVVQGFGAVGYHAARFMAHDGAKLVAASDSRGAVSNPLGLDVAKLREAKLTGQSVSDFPDGQRIGLDALVAVPCDVWIPAARPDALTRENVVRLNAGIVAQGANIPATDEVELYLHQKGILNLPDFIANAGGVICAATEYHGGNETLALQEIAAKIGDNTRIVIERSRRGGIPPREAAMAMAMERVQGAMKTRRWSTFY